MRKIIPPKTPGKCDVDGSELYQREDDKPETVTRRIQVYTQQTAPLINYYQQSGLLVEIDGTKEIDEVSRQLLTAVSKS